MSEIDTAAIRRNGMLPQFRVVLALCDALDAARAEIARLTAIRWDAQQIIEKAESQVAAVRVLLEEDSEGQPGPGISCAGYKVTDGGCFVATLAEKIRAALDGAVPRASREAIDAHLADAPGRVMDGPPQPDTAETLAARMPAAPTHEYESETQWCDHCGEAETHPIHGQ